MHFYVGTPSGVHLFTTFYGLYFQSPITHYNYNFCKFFHVHHWCILSFLSHLSSGAYSYHTIGMLYPLNIVSGYLSKSFFFFFFMWEPIMGFLFSGHRMPLFNSNSTDFYMFIQLMLDRWRHILMKSVVSKPFLFFIRFG